MYIHSNYSFNAWTGLSTSDKSSWEDFFTTRLTDYKLVGADLVTLIRGYCYFEWCMA